MAKITFRASEDLVERLEAFDESKSEILREAVRTYLDGHADSETTDQTLDEFLAKRVDELVAERTAPCRPGSPEVTVNVTLDGETLAAVADEATVRKTAPADRETTAGRDGVARQTEATTCGRCGETLSNGAVYCQNCGEKAARRVFCECGDELRSDWSFCPGCGRRTPAAEVLEGS